MKGIREHHRDFLELSFAYIARSQATIYRLFEHTEHG
jgi:hypothetical protein